VWHSFGDLIFMKCLIILLCLFEINIHAQGPNILFQKNYGSQGNDLLGNIRKTSDGGFLFIATPQSKSGDVHDLQPYMGNYGHDFWVVKLDSYGNILWKKCFGSEYDEYGYDIEETSDGGYILIGQSSPQSPITGPKGEADIWIVKINSIGEVEWEHGYGGSGFEYGYAVKEIENVGYVFLAYSQSTDGDVILSGIENAHLWMVQIDFIGDIVWQKPLGTGNYFIHPYLEKTQDGGFIIGGSNNSWPSTGCNIGYVEGFLLKTDHNGEMQWRKCMGGSYSDLIYDVKQTSDKGYIVCGATNSPEILTGPQHQLDCWVVKTDSIGNILWQNTYGGSMNDAAASIVQTPDGGYAFVATVTSFDGDLSDRSPANTSDCWMVRLNSAGNILSKTCYGGAGNDGFHNDSYGAQLVNAGRLLLTQNGYLFMATSTSSDNGILNHGDRDIWLVHISDLSTNPANERLNSTSFKVYPNPSDSHFIIESAEEGLLEISDVLGKTLLSKKVLVNKADVFLSDQKQGFYNFKFTTEAKTFHYKLLKN
jgi:hypothetical protein